MTAGGSSRGIPSRPGRLHSGAVARIQAWATRLRFVLAVPAAAAVVIFTDRGPMWPGVVAALAGESLQIWASAHLHKNVGIAKSGPYAWARNPMYLGRFFVGLGFVLLTWRWFFIIPYIVGFWVYAHARVSGEEARLQERFGEEYGEYRRAVGRWIPFPPKVRFSDARWSWDAVRRNHQLRITATVIAIIVLLKVRLELWGSLWPGR